MDPSGVPGPSPEGRRLDSWKEIASYLGRTVRTAQNWEKHEGLPVHRHRHGKRGTVFAETAEIDAWLERRSESSEGRSPGRRGTLSWLAWTKRLAVALAVAAALGVAWLASSGTRSRQEPTSASSMAFAERDWILIADFENLTGEAVFDDSLQAAFRRELDVSRRVNVVPRPRIEDALRLMRRPADAALDRATAREVCLRDGGVRAMLVGRIEKLGASYVVSVALVEPREGSTIVAFNERIPEKDEVLAAVHELSRRVRTRLGETLTLPDEEQANLARVTTPSLRALSLYTRADRLVGGVNDAAAEELLRQAVAEDPEFASAWILLAFALRNQDPAFDAYFSGDSDIYRPGEAYVEAAERALGLADATTERERYFIRGGYFSMVGDFERSLAAYQALLEVDPDHQWGVGNLANWLGRLGRGSEARPYRIRLAALRPRHFGIQQAAAEAELESGDVEQASIYAGRAQELLSPEETAERPRQSAWVRLFPAHLAWQRDDAEEAERQLDRLASELIVEPASSRRSLARALHHGYLSIGRTGRALEVYQEYVPSPGRELVAALVAFLEGRSDVVVDLLSRRFPGDGRAPVGYQVYRTILLAQSGADDLVRQAASRFEAEFPQEPSLPVVRGQAAFARGAYDEAERELEGTYATQREIGDLRFWSTAWTLADLHASRGEMERAAEVLEEASSHRSQTYMGSEAHWLAIRVRVWRAYLALGRRAEADRLEEELRRLAARADPAFWVRCALDTPSAPCGGSGLRLWPAAPHGTGD